MDNVLSSANKPLQFGRLCDSSPLPIPSSIPSTLATLSPFNSTDKASQIILHSRASRDFFDLLQTTTQNIESLYMENHNNDSICHVVFQSLDPELSPKSLLSFQMPQFLETVAIVPMRSQLVRFDTIPRTVRSDTKLHEIKLITAPIKAHIAKRVLGAVLSTRLCGVTKSPSPL